MKYRYVLGNKVAIYEHLEFIVKKTTYAHRWKLLEEMNNFADAVEKARKKGKLFVKK